MMKTFEKPELNLGTKETTEASVKAQVAAWNAYYDEVKASELDPLFVELRAAKEAYFTALSAIKDTAAAIMAEKAKLNEGLIREYAPGEEIKSTNITYPAHRAEYIHVNEVSTGKIIN